jgi:nucleoside-diphosphate-sugar epimerase
MKILIAGGAGYIGSALVPKLLERGYIVDVLDLMWFGNHLPEEVRIAKKDIFSVREKDLEGYDQVIFMAGLSNDPMAEFSPGQNFVSNMAAPAYLGYLAKRVGVKRFIHAGSCSVYGYTVDQLYDEVSPAVSNYPYGIAKLQGAAALIQMIDEHFSVISLRQGTVSGYSPRMRLDLIVNTMFRTGMAKGEIIVNNPAIWRPILSIKDAVSAYIRSVEANEGISGIFNVASGNYTVGEVGDIVRDTIERHYHNKIKLTMMHVQDYRNYKVSIEKAEKVLSFKPKYDISAVVGDLIENYSEFKDFDNPNYYNIQVFEKLARSGNSSNSLF